MRVLVLIEQRFYHRAGDVPHHAGTGSPLGASKTGTACSPSSSSLGGRGFDAVNTPDEANLNRMMVKRPR